MSWLISGVTVHLRVNTCRLDLETEVNIENMKGWSNSFNDGRWQKNKKWEKVTDCKN